MPDVSIIIPTNRGPDVLAPCLQSIASQRFDQRRIEVFVVYNGVCEPPHWDVADWPFRLRVLHMTQANIAAAKNLALDAARGEWIVLLNDDVRLDAGFVDAHLAAHAGLDEPAMVLGASHWRRYADQTVFDELIQRTAMIFFYEGLRPHAWHNFRHAWNLNLSLRRGRLGGRRFDARLGPFFYEDLELAYRLEVEAGVRVWYEPQARLLHDHRYTLDGYLRREAEMGRAALRLWRVNPDCFRSVYGAPLDSDYLAYCRRYVALEGRYEALQLDALRRAVEQPLDAAPHLAGGDAAWLQVLYQAHLPLKRLAFRRALLESAGVDLRAPDPTASHGASEPNAHQAACVSAAW